MQVKLPGRSFAGVAVTVIAGVAAATIVGAPGAAAASSTGPTGAQIRAAVARAEQSRYVWATVNICNTRRHPDTIGIRAQMPALGFPTNLSMQIQVEYWSHARKRFLPDPGVTKLLELGRLATGLHQAGFMFRFKPPVLLSGKVTFKWKLAGKALGSTTRPTSHGIKHVDDGDPPGYSTATCTIK